MLFRSPDDGRRILIHLTDAGRALIDEQRPAVEALEKRMLDGLGASEVEVVRDALNRMRQNLEAG